MQRPGVDVADIARPPLGVRLELDAPSRPSAGPTWGSRASVPGTMHGRLVAFRWRSCERAGRVGLSTPDQAPGQLVGGLAVVVRLPAGHDGVAPAGGALQQAAAAGRQVVHDRRLVEAEPIEVDDVEVGAIAGGDDAPVVQTDGAGGVATVTLHEERQRDQVVVTVATPVGEQRGREAAVADRADVCATVAEARERCAGG